MVNLARTRKHWHRQC